MVHPQLCRTAVPDSSRVPVREPHGHRPFYTYYQISRADESDEAETEPENEEELKSGYTGSHSLFGFVWQIADATGWSVDYILHKVNYQTLIMMLSDAPRSRTDTKRGKMTNKISGASEKEEAAAVNNYFVSNLKK